MSFQNFITTIFNSFNAFFTHIVSYINLVIDNNFIKLIIYLVLFKLIIDFLFEVIKILLKIINNGHNKELKNKKEKENKVE